MSGAPAPSGKGTQPPALGPLVVAIFATLCLAVFLAPMRSAILWSIILAILFIRINETLAERWNGRNSAAAATVTIIFFTAIIPMLLIALLVIAQVNSLASRADVISRSFLAFLSDMMARVPDFLRVRIDDLVAASQIGTPEIGDWVLPVVTYTFSLGVNVVLAIGMLFAALYVTFFLLRDWRSITEFLSATVPLRQRHKAVLARRLAETIDATVRGVLLVAAAQAAVAGVVYWALGLEAFAVLAVLTFVGCLIPAIGSGLIWVPVAIFFVATGDYTKAVIMAATGVFVISMVDNILRPRLIAEKAALPDFLIFLSSFGGLAIAGFDGLFLGPIVAAFFVESWKVYKEAAGADGDLHANEESGSSQQ